MNEGAETLVKSTSEVTKKYKYGVLYLGRVPEKMTPSRVRQMLAKYGEIGRVFLQAEDDYFRQQRRKRGGSKARLYTEGWIEFKKKRTAKRVAASLHNTRMGEKKRDAYYDELWSLKYLPRFKWAHLVERLEFEKQVRIQRGRMELTQAKKETAAYIQNVEQSKRLQKMKEKKEKQGKVWTQGQHEFHQVRTESEINHERPVKQSGKIAKSTLAKIFKKT
ncbi:activator of basal transcription 1-like isoform X2 [Apostichopus japonicus]|uniref:activator of basal transcription 1-like isoform X1 n=1 Tax=Stichopus japonicus TaxID=307972 RepID=UPI003AB85378